MIYPVILTLLMALVLMLLGPAMLTNPLLLCTMCLSLIATLICGLWFMKILRNRGNTLVPVVRIVSCWLLGIIIIHVDIIAVFAGILGAVFPHAPSLLLGQIVFLVLGCLIVSLGTTYSDYIKRQDQSDSAATNLRSQLSKIALDIDREYSAKANELGLAIGNTSTPAATLRLRMETVGPSSPQTEEVDRDILALAHELKQIVSDSNGDEFNKIVSDRCRQLIRKLESREMIASPQMVL